MDKIKLREIEKKDIKKINSWRNDKEVVDLLGNNYLFISSEIDEKWFEDYSLNRDKAIRLAILDKKTGKYIGNVNLTSIHPINRSAEFSIFIGDKSYWSKGCGSEATVAMVEHGFNDLNLNRIYLTVLENNKRAIKTYNRIGFKKEGILKEAVYKNSRFHNVILMSVLKKDFNKKVRKP